MLHKVGSLIWRKKHGCKTLDSDYFRQSFQVIIIFLKGGESSNFNNKFFRLPFRTFIRNEASAAAPNNLSSNECHMYYRASSPHHMEKTHTVLASPPKMPLVSLKNAYHTETSKEKSCKFFSYYAPSPRYILYKRLNQRPFPWYFCFNILF